MLISSGVLFVVAGLVLIGFDLHFPASIQANDRYGDQYAVMFSLVMTQLKQVKPET